MKLSRKWPVLVLIAFWCASIAVVVVVGADSQDEGPVVENGEEFLVSYILEPFEADDGYGTTDSCLMIFFNDILEGQTYGNLAEEHGTARIETLGSTAPPHGSSALRLDYNYVNLLFPNLQPNSDQNKDNTHNPNYLYAIRSVLPGFSVYSLQGAQQLSFSYRHEWKWTKYFGEKGRDDAGDGDPDEELVNFDHKGMADSLIDLEWRFSFLDASNCHEDCSNPRNLQEWTYSVSNADFRVDSIGSGDASSSSWKTVKLLLNNTSDAWKLSPWNPGRSPWNPDSAQTHDDIDSKSSNDQATTKELPSPPPPSLRIPAKSGGGAPLLGVKESSSTQHFRFSQWASFSCVAFGSRCSYDSSQFPKDDAESVLRSEGGAFYQQSAASSTLWIVAQPESNELELNGLNTCPEETGCVVSCDSGCSCTDLTTNTQCDKVDSTTTSTTPSPPDTSSSTTAHSMLDLRSIKGWQLMVFGKKPASSSSPTDGSGNNDDELMLKGALWIDQIAVQGQGDLFGKAVFPDSWEQAKQSDVVADWDDPTNNAPEDSNSNSGSDSENILGSGMFVLDYQRFVSYDFVAPGRSYYNLSMADQLQLDYCVLRPASVSDLAHLRLKLLDSSDCRNASCGQHFSQNLEHYYSFQHILDEAFPNEDGDNSSMDNAPEDDPQAEQCRHRKTLQVDLWGNSNPESPLWRTGWTGSVGNNVFDKAFVKGFQIQIGMNSEEDIGSQLTGALELSHLRVAKKPPASPTNPPTLVPSPPPTAGPTEFPTDVPTKSNPPAVQAIAPGPLEVLVHLSVNFEFVIADWAKEGIHGLRLWVERQNPRSVTWSYVVEGLDIDQEMQVPAVSSSSNGVVYRVNTAMPNYGMFRWYVEVDPKPEMPQLSDLSDNKQHFWIQEAPTLSALIALMSDLSLFRWALRATELLMDEIDNPSSQPYTIFAPTNSALGQMGGMDALTALLESREGQETLKFVLKNHIIPGPAIDCKELQEKGKENSDQPKRLETLATGSFVDIIVQSNSTSDQGKDHANIIMVKGIGNAARRKIPMIIVRDIHASNGIIHVIDAIINPYQQMNGTASETATDAANP